MFRTLAMTLLVIISATLLNAGSAACNSSHPDSTVLAEMWLPPLQGSANSLGKLIVIPNQPSNSDRLAREIIIDPIGKPFIFKGADCELEGTVHKVRLHFLCGDNRFTVNLLIESSDNRTGTITVSGSQFAVSSISLTDWPSSLHSINIEVPYYSGSIRYLSEQRLFSNVYFDWTASNATRLSTVSATYEPRTNNSRANLMERIVFKTSKNFDNVLPDINNPKSPYVDELSGRLIIDIWGPNFGQITKALNTLRQFGLRRCVVLIHDWQRSGYDNALPAHYPASESLGGERNLSDAISAGKSAECYVGLHENYVDYYPNFDGFDTSAIALDSKGNKQLAWRNNITGIQSFATKPDSFVTLASSQSPEIHRRYGTTASFIDVNSSVVPWWRADMSATSAAPAEFSAFYVSSISLWNFERKAHNGPVFGEGNQHWFWSGLLDGVEAQSGAAKINLAGPEQPLFVDFDLLKIHPLAVNHGMGYYTRWLAKGADINSDLLDMYRMQEIAFGHAPFLGADLWSSVPQMMIEQNLIGTVAARYGNQYVKSIQYEVNGVWTTTDEAIRVQDWSRPKIEYANGDVIVANNGKSMINWKGISIPIHGWAAKGINLRAFTALIGGHTVDYSETESSVFANSRNQSDNSGIEYFAQPEVKAVTQSTSKILTVEIKWNILNKGATEDLKTFIHFALPGQVEEGQIAFQGDRWPYAATSKWMPGEEFVDRAIQVSIPADVSDGSYSVLVGLYSPNSGQRAKLLGKDLGGRRYFGGILTVSGQGKKITFEPRGKVERKLDAESNAKGNLVDFGTLMTDGIISLRRSGGTWEAHVFPATRDVIVKLSSSHFHVPASVACDGSSLATTQHPIQVNGFWRLEAKGSSTCSWTDISAN